MIRVQNIYHMLAYAFQVLREQGYADVAAEKFDNTAELLAAILARGVSSQVKRGLGREYLPRTEALATLRGRIDVAETVKARAVLRRQMVCDYDEFSIDAPMNRMLKATMRLLVRSDIDKARRKELRGLLVYFADVADIDLASVDWHLRFDRGNQTYRMLMNVCWLVAEGLLQTQEDGTVRLANFLDEQRMSRLYEKFILEYYRREHPDLRAEAPYIKWALDDGPHGAGAFGGALDMLPAMHSDVMLSRSGNMLIIDAKYYAHTTQRHFDKHTYHSGNLYQIFTYVKNKEAELAGAEHTVSGLLLYAGTDEEVQPSGTYLMSGNRIGVRTLNLNQPFEAIRAQLDAIVEEHF
ncbi:5-methylcytosine-specific restriction endonuclease system specificity protein McrC [Collinsella sp. D33t1_170424_A12]|uniref:5-methylcytosine-specific restriction endonuclease system specificity protein McrC n=1 Tax=Collinsella sp. D33t1_170424_A12 TaxID=2787135 RepID=UPI001899DCE3